MNVRTIYWDPRTIPPSYWPGIQADDTDFARVPMVPLPIFSPHLQTSVRHAVSNYPSVSQPLSPPDILLSTLWSPSDSDQLPSSSTDPKTIPWLECPKCPFPKSYPRSITGTIFCPECATPLLPVSQLVPPSSSRSSSHQKITCPCGTQNFLPHSMTSIFCGSCAAVLTINQQTTSSNASQSPLPSSPPTRMLEAIFTSPSSHATVAPTDVASSLPESMIDMNSTPLSSSSDTSKETEIDSVPAELMPYLERELQSGCTDITNRWAPLRPFPPVNELKPQLNSFRWKEPIDDYYRQGKSMIEAAEKNDLPQLMKHVQGPTERKDRYELSEKHCCINSQDLYLRTALHVAASEGNTEMAGWLLENGADVRIRSRFVRFLVVLYLPLSLAHYCILFIF